MLFSSLTFLTIFLPLTIILYFLIPTRFLKNVLLLIASLIFYAWGEPIFVLLMIFMVTLDYFSVIYVDLLKRKQKIHLAKFLYITTIIINLSSLAFFKYINFFIENINAIAKLNIAAIEVVMPIGISFYTFQILSYVIDAYHQRVKVQKNWILLMTYLSLFPQLIAGPIVRYSTVENELEHRQENWDEVYLGLQRFILGLGKKVIIANNVAIVANHVFSLPMSELNFTLAWAGVIAFTFQIYFDFSAYSDMAIGIGHIFGFHFLENFNYPYLSKSITEFWRRWHMSLGTWFKDYVYIPLGGNQGSPLRWFFNILIVWFLTGLWHGASWNFILWGLYFAFFLILEKAFLSKILSKLPIINIAYTLILVIFGWVIFNAKDIEHIQVLIRNMLDTNQGFNFSILQFAYIHFTWPYFVLALIGSTPLIKNVLVLFRKFSLTRLIVLPYLALILYLSFMYLVNESYNPFIYFRF